MICRLSSQVTMVASVMRRFMAAAGPIAVRPGSVVPAIRAPKKVRPALGEEMRTEADQWVALKAASSPRIFRLRIRFQVYEADGRLSATSRQRFPHNVDRLFRRHRNPFRRQMGTF